MAKLSELERIYPTISAAEVRTFARKDQAAHELAIRLLNPNQKGVLETADRYSLAERNLAFLYPRTFYNIPGGGASQFAVDLVGIGLERAAEKGPNSILVLLAGHGSGLIRPYDNDGILRPIARRMLPREKKDVVTNSHFEAHIAHENCEVGCGGAQGKTEVVIDNINNHEKEIVEKYLTQTGKDTFVLKGSPRTNVSFMSVLSATGLPKNGCQECAWNPYDRNWKRADTKFLISKGLDKIPDPETAKTSQYLTREQLNQILRPYLLEQITGAGCLDVRQEMIGEVSDFLDTNKVNADVVDARSAFDKWVMMKGIEYANDYFQTWIHSESGINTINITSANGIEDPIALQQAIALAKMPQALVNHSLRSDMQGTRRGGGQRTISPATSTLINMPDVFFTDERYQAKFQEFGAVVTQLVQSLDAAGYRHESNLNDYFGSLQSELLAQIGDNIYRVNYGQGLQFDVPNTKIGSDILEAVRPAKADRMIDRNKDTYNPNPKHTIHAGTERTLGVQIA